jgi:hypothetical protein
MIRTFKEARDQARAEKRTITEAVLRGDDTVETITFGPRGGWFSKGKALRTRADLAKHPGFVHLSTDSGGVPNAWLNHYSCQSCTSEQVDWSIQWSCQCNDECPNCGAEIEPVSSEFLGDEAAEAIWNALPEVL